MISSRLLSKLSFQTSRDPALRAMLVSLLAFGPGAGAAQNEVEFDIPVGPLSVTLLRISELTGTLTSFSPELVEAHTAPAIRGRFTLEQAMSRALQSSGLVAEKLSVGSMTIRVLVPGAKGAAMAAGTPPSDPSSTSEGVPIAALPTVVVHGSGLSRNDDGLRGLRSWSATRGDTPLAELPQAVSVLTPAALELQGGASSTDALGHVPGLTEILDFAGSGARFMPAHQVRGFAAAYTFSGMRTTRTAVPLDLALVERIEVPKGPSGVVSGMAGQGFAFVSELGGTINYERKRAGADTPVRMAQTLDSADGGTLRVAGDVGGAWLGDTRWRMVGYASKSGRSDGGYEPRNGTGLLNSLQWQRGPLSAGLTLQVDGGRDVPAPSGRGGLRRLDDNSLAIVPLEPGVAEPLNPQDGLRSRGADLDLDLGVQLSPKWRVDWRGRAEVVRNEWSRTELLFRPLSASTTNRLREMQVNLSGEVATGAATHKLLLGIDVQRTREIEVLFTGQQGEPFVSDIVESRQQLLLQDQISLGPWRLRLAAQRARTSGLDVVARSQPVEAIGTNGGTNGDVGLLYQWRPSMALYGGLQSTVEAGRYTLDQVVLPDGSLRPPARMTQVQLGLRMDLLDRSMTLSAEAFRIRKFNTTIATVDGLVLVPGRYVNGLELELSGRPSPNLEFSLGYTAMRARDVSYGGDTPAELFSVESRTAGIPGRSLQLLARLRLPEQVLSDATLGIGLRAASDMLVGIPGASLGVFGRTADYRLPGGGQLDVLLERLFGPWAVKAFVRNLTDQQIYTPTYEVSYLPLQPARHFGLTVTYKD